MKHSIINALYETCNEGFSHAVVPNIIPIEVEKKNMKLYQQINNLITVPLRTECIQEMYTPSKLSK